MTFKVEIVNVADNIDNIILISGLTIEILKIKYNWVLNANVKNCILGEDKNGLVWFSGEWICGEWENGTWYSGIWHDGTWKNGNWYSYLIDKAMIISNRFVILNTNRTYSEFRNGIWKDGNFYNGTFGYDRNIDGKIELELIDKNFQCSYWEKGKFYDGLFKNSVWFDGLFYYGDMLNSYWLNGKFYSGTFNYHNLGGTKNWYNGNWYGGDFIEGNWGNGIFDQIDNNIKSRFGISNSGNAMTIWWNGDFYNGEFHSGLNIDYSGNTIPDTNNGKTHWMNGNFRGGSWYGGHFENGHFYNGQWYGGVFNTKTGSTMMNTCIWHNGNWFNGLWINGIFEYGHFYNGIILDGLFLNGYISTNKKENILLKQILSPSIILPTVSAVTITSIGLYNVVAYAKVINNGGSPIIERGFCWSIFPNPVYGIINSTNNYSLDYGTIGNMTMNINELDDSTNYYIRAFVRNTTGLTYSNELEFSTLVIPNNVPRIVTVDVGTDITSSSALLKGYVTSTDSTIIECGFYWSDIVNNPGPMDNIITGNTVQIGNFASLLNSLTPETQYYFKAYAENSAGIGTGTTLSFITSSYSTAYIPIVSFKEISYLYDTSAILSGNIEDNGGDTIISVGICWSLTETEPDLTDNTYSTTYTGTPFSAIMSPLISGTLYYYRLFATNSAGTGYSESKSLTTTSIPVVNLLSVIAI